VALVPEPNRIDRKPLCLGPREDPAVLRGDEGCGISTTPHPPKLFHDPDLLPSPAV
jgi:hypothetical protein